MGAATSGSASATALSIGCGSVLRASAGGDWSCSGSCARASAAAGAGEAGSSTDAGEGEGEGDVDGAAATPSPSDEAGGLTGRTRRLGVGVRHCCDEAPTRRLAAPASALPTHCSGKSASGLSEAATALGSTSRAGTADGPEVEAEAEADSSIADSSEFTDISSKVDI